MPELPEVETIRLQLQRRVKGKKITSVEVIFGRKINVPAAKFIRAVKGAKIEAVGRRAKLLLIQLSNGLTMMIHLKMTGRVLLRPRGEKPGKHTFVVFGLSGGEQLFWEDVRKFGFLKLVPTRELPAYWKKEGFGPEPLARDFTPEVLRACLTQHKGKKIKPLLMEPRCVAGLGNIYAAEALWYARVHPGRAAGALTDVEMQELYEGIGRVLSAAIRHRGTSADSYVDLFGEVGEFVPRLKVYGRAGKPCGRKCGALIKKVTLGGRGTYFCPECQK